ncbi:MAG TPA: hypothetical protein VNC50_16230 [Planctomycetia bacterium]|nr:hypothetical protein [Planctomycetia bacterium]
MSDDLQARLLRLERRNRQLGALLGVAFLAAPAFWMTQSVKADDKSDAVPIVAGEQILLKNASGAKAATLWSTPEGSNLSLCDAAGQPRLVLTVGKEGPALLLLDGAGSAGSGVKLALSANPKSGPSLLLFGDEKGAPLAALRAKPGSKEAAAQGQLLVTNGDKQQVAFPRTVVDPLDDGDPTKAPKPNPLAGGGAGQPK